MRDQDNDGSVLYTYFVFVPPRYIKVGSSISPRNRAWKKAKRPSDADLKLAEPLGCVPSIVISESATKNRLRPHLADGCREWFVTCPDVEDFIDSLPLQDFPRRRFGPSRLMTAAEYEVFSAERAKRMAGAQR